MAAMLWEKVTVGRVHVVYLTAGVALIVENLAEVYLFDSSGLRAIANQLSGFFLSSTVSKLPLGLVCSVIVLAALGVTAAVFRSGGGLQTR